MSKLLTTEAKQDQPQRRLPRWMILMAILIVVSLFLACLLMLIDPASFEPLRSKFGLP